MYSSRVCVENRCVSTPARTDHVQPRALDGARSFFSLYVFSNLPVSGIQGQTEIFISPKPQTFESGVNSNPQQATNTQVYDGFPLIRMRSMNKSDELFGREGNVRAARPTKHIKFKTNKLTTAASQDQSQLKMRFGVVFSMIITSVMHTVSGWVFANIIVCTGQKPQHETKIDFQKVFFVGCF